MAKIDELFRLLVDKKASDLHLTAGSMPFIRVHGDMTKLDMPVMSNEEVQTLIFEILSEKQKRLFLENWELDCSHYLEGVARFRCNVFMQRKGMGAVFRVIPDKIKTFEDLNLPKEFLHLIDVHKGLICVTGPTGSGKSTTLAAIINHINTTRKAHIITIEDPIEFVHNNQTSLVNQREVTSHTKSFANALKATLREDPDIILLGEMRDLETISLALTAAETGHLVFGTLHTSSAHKTVDRIIDVFPENRQAQVRTQLAESLRGVISQTLLTRADGVGRCAAFECLITNKAISNLIREGKTYQIPSTMQISKGSGCITFEQSIMGLVQKGMLNKEQAADALGVAVAPTPAPPPAAEGAAEGDAAAPGKEVAPGFFKLATPPAGTAPKPAGAPAGQAAQAAQAAGAALGNLADRFRKAK